jgi:hypothetical protein
VSRYQELASKVDAFFARVQSRHGNDLQCGSGCSDCCHVRLTITQVEARAIRAEVASWDDERRSALVAAAAAAPRDRCVALDSTGRCLIYAARPFVCRSHGAPIRIPARDARDDDAAMRLPVIQSCFRNFTHTEPEPDCILDQTTLSALVLALDRDAGGDGGRVDLADVIAGC